MLAELIALILETLAEVLPEDAVNALLNLLG